MIRAGVVGATGLVGAAMMQVLQERSFPVDEFQAYGSGRSQGRTVRFGDRDYPVEIITPGGIRKGMILFGATSSTIARNWVPFAADAGAVIIDNSSAYRMDPEIPLVVPEVNGKCITGDETIIANPNCSTIQLVVALAPLFSLGDVDWVSVSTYQAASGAGSALLEQLAGEERGVSGSTTGQTLHRNVITRIGELDANGFCFEETKLIEETCKITGKRFPVYPSVARVPVETGHTESVVVKFREPVRVSDAAGVLEGADGVSVCSVMCTPVEAAGRDEVFVDRLRNHPSDASVLQFWVIADNLRKGAALNAVQIAEILLERESFLRRTNQ